MHTPFARHPSYLRDESMVRADATAPSLGAVKPRLSLRSGWAASIDSGAQREQLVALIFSATNG